MVRFLYSALSPERNISAGCTLEAFVQEAWPARGNRRATDLRTRIPQSKKDETLGSLTKGQENLVGKLLKFMELHRSS